MTTWTTISARRTDSTPKKSSRRPIRRGKPHQLSLFPSSRPANLHLATLRRAARISWGMRARTPRSAALHTGISGPPSNQIRRRSDARFDSCHRGAFDIGDTGMNFQSVRRAAPAAEKRPRNGARRRTIPPRRQMGLFLCLKSLTNPYAPARRTSVIGVVNDAAGIGILEIDAYGKHMDPAANRPPPPHSSPASMPLIMFVTVAGRAAASAPGPVAFWASIPPAGRPHEETPAE